VTEAQESDLIEKKYTHGPVDLTLTINSVNRQATLKVAVSGNVTASATVQEGRPSDKIVSHQLAGDLTLRLEAHEVTITGRLEDGPVNHEVSLP
jgi:polyisoprenoid-binding protein YceI